MPPVYTMFVACHAPDDRFFLLATRQYSAMSTCRARIFFATTFTSTFEKVQKSAIVLVHTHTHEVNDSPNRRVLLWPFRERWRENKNFSFSRKKPTTRSRKKGVLPLHKTLFVLKKNDRLLKKNGFFRLPRRGRTGTCYFGRIIVLTWTQLRTDWQDRWEYLSTTNAGKTAPIERPPQQTRPLVRRRRQSSCWPHCCWEAAA